MQQSSDLLAVAREIAQEFPLVPDRTGLLLYDVDPDRLQAQWQVTLEDFARALGAFPAGAEGVTPVLRLLQVDANGQQAKLVESIPQAAGQGMAGSARFAVDAQGAFFVSELGIESADGGWLLLARSNRVQLPHREAAPAREDLGPVDPTLTAPEAPLEPVFPLPRWAPRVHRTPATPAGGAHGGQATEAIAADSPPGVVPGAPAGGIELPPPLPPSTRPGLTAEGPFALTFYDPRAAISSRELQRSAFQPDTR